MLQPASAQEQRGRVLTTSVLPPVYPEGRSIAGHPSTQLPATVMLCLFLNHLAGHTRITTVAELYHVALSASVGNPASRAKRSRFINSAGSISPGELTYRRSSSSVASGGVHPHVCPCEHASPSCLKSLLSVGGQHQRQRQLRFLISDRGRPSSSSGSERCSPPTLPSSNVVKLMHGNS